MILSKYFRSSPTTIFLLAYLYYLNPSSFSVKKLWFSIEWSYNKHKQLYFRFHDLTIHLRCFQFFQVPSRQLPSKICTYKHTTFDQPLLHTTSKSYCSNSAQVIMYGTSTNKISNVPFNSAQIVSNSIITACRST